MKNQFDFGRLKREEISKYTKSLDWQRFRSSLKGLSRDEKIKALKKYLINHQYSKAAKVRVGNYYNALKRGGQA